MDAKNNNYDQWLLDGESQTLEFKTSFDKTTVESLVAFANTQGGIVLVGVSDAGVALGVSLVKETLNEWLVQIKSVTSPSIIPRPGNRCCEWQNHRDHSC